MPRLVAYYYTFGLILALSHTCMLHRSMRHHLNSADIKAEKGPIHTQPPPGYTRTYTCIHTVSITICGGKGLIFTDA